MTINSKKNKLISIIIPVYNEENTILDLLKKVLEINLNKINYEKEIIIVNDGSKDNSKQLIEQFIIKNNTFENCIGIKQINLEKNKGKGNAIKTGVLDSNGDLIIIQDADLEYNPDDYFNLIYHIENSKFDFIYGSRLLGYFKFGNIYSSIGFLLGGISVSILCSILNLKIITDEPTCYKLFTKKLKQFLVLPSENGFEREPAITTLLLRKKFSYGEIAIQYKARNFEQGKKIKIIDGLKALYTLFIRRFKNI